jgi:hypothetical protein
VIDHTTAPNPSVIDHRRKQVRLATARHRKRRKYGQFLRTITVTKGDLDQLEERGYLSSNDRGEPRAESEAIETFIMNSLLKP